MDGISHVPPFSYGMLGLMYLTHSRFVPGGPEGALIAHSKDWAIILFACMSTHVLHIEVVESMDTSSFINVQLYSVDS